MFQYNAFISYRRLEPDQSIALELRRALENYRVPRPLVKQGIAPRLKRVFRDDEELASGPLPPKLRNALKQSEFLIVVCSPRTPESKWITEEIAWFQELGRGDQILPLLIEGSPDESFPKEIRATRPLAADVRPLGDKSR